MKIHAKIQRWGNGLALRVSGVMRDIPHFEEGTEVTVEITEAGLVVKKIPPRTTVSFTEAQLLDHITPFNAHADELADLSDHVTGHL